MLITLLRRPPPSVEVFQLLLKCGGVFFEEWPTWRGRGRWKKKMESIFLLHTHCFPPSLCKKMAAQARAVFEAMRKAAEQGVAPAQQVIN
jgi:hypothetical protein